MTSGIYCITNNINDKKYIGQSVNIKKRQRRHFYDLDTNNHDNAYLQRAYNKYGKENFSFLLIKACKPKYLNRFEKMYIKIYNTYQDGYNLTTGGQSPFEKKNNHRHTLSNCIKMSKNKNTTGYFRVYYETNRYKYRWYENKKRKSISSKYIEKLKEKVINKGLPWYKI